MFTFAQSKHTKPLKISGVTKLKRKGRVSVRVRIRFLSSGHFSKSDFSKRGKKDQNRPENRFLLSDFRFTSFYI